MASDMTVSTKPKRERGGFIRVKMLAREPFLLGLIVLVFLSLFLFAVLPIYQVIKVTVVGDAGADLSKIGEVLQGHFLHVMWNSIQLGLLSAVLSTVVGFVFAFAIARTDIRGKRLFHLIALLPIISPPFVLALSTILLFGRNGIITHGLLGLEDADVYGLGSLVFIQTMAFFPLAYLNLRGVLESINPSVEDASLNLGASRWQVFRTVTLPLAVPGIFSSLLIVFIKSIEDFGNPMVLAGDYSTLAVQAYLEITGMYDLRSGSFMAVAILLPSITAFLIQKHWLSKKSYVTVTGKPTQSSVRMGEKRMVYPLFAFCALVTSVVLLFYGTVAAGAFIKLWGINFTFTLEHFSYIFTLGFDSILNSTLLAAASTPLTAILGMAIAWLVVRESFIGKKVMELSSILTFAVPGTVVGIGYVLAFNKPPLLLTGTALILIAAFTFRNMSVGIEAGTNSLRQIDASIEEASKNLGASSFVTFWRISLPLMRSALFSGLVYSFVRSMTSISAVIFLVSANWNLLTVSILSQVEASRLGAASAYCVLLIAMILFAIGLLQFLVNQLQPKNRRRA
ncbi:iron ABC transporter permease [Brevibacillus brevis]|uniref:Iron ABC transporter permease n=1 Tax=Brevibacillus brevis TaxID=1393 RepID=A0ABY9TA67_BREBE|nr:iron ABC transporter permease [Brevibacillus brevis]WNC17002.1 iron ABC transporter permease [Brevibacillus brevis]